VRMSLWRASVLTKRAAWRTLATRNVAHRDDAKCSEVKLT
jgi:hypothetical protein